MSSDASAENPLYLPAGWVALVCGRCGNRQAYPPGVWERRTEYEADPDRMDLLTCWRPLATNGAFCEGRLQRPLL